MPKRQGKYTLLLPSEPSIIGSAAVAGKKEKEGPMGTYFDLCFQDTTLGEERWEKAEARMQTEAVNLAIQKAGLTNAAIQYIFAGDLLNQCISSSFGLRGLGIPFLGQYGACSTMAQTISLAALLVDCGAAKHCAAVTSSHFCSAERQFRFPLEYGGQRTPTAQWTATASGSAILGAHQTDTPFVAAITIGKITDLGIKDAANMGAAMAPAAMQTLLDFLNDTHTTPDDYDLILTGDLGSVGAALLKELLAKEGVSLSSNYNDCGILIYDAQKQDVHAGGSGCGCSAAIVCSYLFQKMREGAFRNVLFLGTGALMSPTSSQQGESIPGIAHLLQFRMPS